MPAADRTLRVRFGGASEPLLSATRVRLVATDTEAALGFADVAVLDGCCLPCTPVAVVAFRTERLRGILRPLSLSSTSDFFVAVAGFRCTRRLLGTGVSSSESSLSRFRVVTRACALGSFGVEVFGGSLRDAVAAGGLGSPGITLGGGGNDLSFAATVCSTVLPRTALGFTLVCPSSVPSPRVLVRDAPDTVRRAIAGLSAGSPFASTLLRTVAGTLDRAGGLGRDGFAGRSSE